MTAKELKQKYLDFFESHAHSIIESASLIPENDPTVLFTTAGMHPLIPYLLGQKHPQGNRLADAQKCIRTGDIDSVGDNWHLTFFEMLGNWSLGDYFKKEAIEYSWEFLTDEKWLAINPEKIYVSVFGGDKDAPFDKEAYDAWISAGIEPERIFKYGKDQNWWGPAGQTGPCGPDTEMYYDTGKPACPKCKEKGIACDCGKYAEIWNDVFMEYNKTADGKYLFLKQKNVDTGMGLERTLAVLQGFDNVYEIETFKPLILELEKISQKKYQASSENTKAMRIIADHLKTACFILADDRGISPSNIEQGYVLRRLIRRAIRYGKSLGIGEVFSHKIADQIIDIYKDNYQELEKNKNFIISQLDQEEEKFKKTLAKGLNKFQKIAEKGSISGMEAFDLYATYGFPLELTKELAKEKGMVVDEESFQQEFKKHQQLSRQGTEQKFKSGLADHSIETTKLHTAAHLMLAALRKVLGNHVFQKGSNITSQRLRFDFSHPEKMAQDQIKQVEDLVNKIIKKDLEVKCDQMSVEQAKEQSAMGVFEHKYSDQVTVYTVDDFSKEICAGPHVKRTGQLGHFKIIKEESCAAGIRRIKAILE